MTRILYVTNALRSGPWIGCAIRTLNICQQLRRLGQVTCIAVGDIVPDDSVRAAQEVSDSFEFFRIPNYFYSTGLSGRFKHKYYMHWPGLVGPAISSGDREKFQRLLKEHDLVWFHTPTSAASFGSLSIPRSVMDLDDLNHVKLQLQAGQSASVRFKLSARVQSFKWRRIEMTAPWRYQGVVVCSRIDREILGAGDNVFVIPNGFAEPSEKPQWSNPDGTRLGFIGTLSYAPNLDGLKWFAGQVWPLVRKARPDIRFRIIGSLPSDVQWLHDIDGFEPLGYVKDTGQEFKTWSAMAVPLLVGGGTRIKILEAFSRFCPVVSTSVGAYGLEVEGHKHLIMADTPQAFADQCLRLCTDSGAGQKLAQEAWNLFVQKYTWGQIGSSIHHVVEHCLEVK
jgi:glycosyltransferase involved in cell wall biosynthesis